MTETTILDGDSGARPLRVPLNEPSCFAWGGVAFDVYPAAGLRFRLEGPHAEFCAPYGIAPIAGHVRVSLDASPELERESTREMGWRWDGDLARVRAGRVRAELRRMGRGNYVASALVVPDDTGFAALASVLPAAIVDREGGLVLHAVGLELDRRAVLFVGPSGAGKTTAANLTPGAHWFARDRAAIYPTSNGWYAVGMAGGDPIDLPQAPPRPLPLASVMRIRQGRASSIAPLAGAAAAAALRESTLAVEAASELELLERGLAVAWDARVLELTTAIGQPHTALLRAYLEASQ